MPCLLAILALLTPRLVIVILFLFTGFMHTGYQGVPVVWPILGFVFLPLTTLAYALAINHAGAVDGVYILILIVAVIIDLGSYGGSATSRK